MANIGSLLVQFLCVLGMMQQLGIKDASLTLKANGDGLLWLSCLKCNFSDRPWKTSLSFLSYIVCDSIKTVKSVPNKCLLVLDGISELMKCLGECEL